MNITRISIITSKEGMFLTILKSLISLTLMKVNMTELSTSLIHIVQETSEEDHHLPHHLVQEEAGAGHHPSEEDPVLRVSWTLAESPAPEDYLFLW